MRGLTIIRLAFIAIFIVVLFSALSYSQDIKSSVDITEVGMGARPIALGGAYVGLADDASAIFTNPAGLGLQNRLSFVSMSTQILTTVNYSLAGISYPTKYGTFGVGYINATSPAGNYTYVSGGVTIEGEAINYTNSMLILSYGCDISNPVNSVLKYKDDRVQNLAVGANIKILSQGLSGGIDDSLSASGLEADLGVLYIPSDSLSLGATLQNTYKGSNGASDSWSTDQKENLPTILKLGCSYKVTSSVKLLLDADYYVDGGQNATLHGGSEWQVIPLLALRAGFDQKNEAIDDETTGVITNLSLGVGITFNNIRFDYAYRQDSAFSEFSTHYFSFSFIGDQPEEKTTTALANKPEHAEDSVESKEYKYSQEETAVKKDNTSNPKDYNIGKDSEMKGISDYEKLFEKTSK